MRLLIWQRSERSHGRNWQAGRLAGVIEDGFRCRRSGRATRDGSLQKRVFLLKTHPALASVVTHYF